MIFEKLKNIFSFGFIAFSALAADHAIGVLLAKVLADTDAVKLIFRQAHRCSAVGK